MTGNPVRGEIIKADREKAAADKLFGKLPADQGQMIRNLWEEFDAMATADAKYAVCLDRLQPFLHNTLTDGHTWGNGKIPRESVEKRTAIIREFMPEVYRWMTVNMDRAVEKGWIAPSA